MINGISITSRYMVAHGGHGGGTYINGSSGSQGVGNMRYNTSLQKMEVFDGISWITINTTTASVGLSGEAESLLDWVRKKREEEEELERLAKENVAINDLLEQIKEKQHQIKMVQTLIRKETHVQYQPV